MKHVTTFDEAAKIVSDDLYKTIKDEGFNNFKEMAKCYWWDSNDIRDEITYILEHETDAWIWDDGSHVQVGLDDIYYRDFKKIVMNYLRQLENR